MKEKKKKEDHKLPADEWEIRQLYMAVSPEDPIQFMALSRLKRKPEKCKKKG